MGQVEDLTNQKFNRLKVVKRVENDKYHNAVWECICDCGNITNVVASHLRRGLVKSCGCLHIETARKQGLAALKNILGQTFGRLTVVAKGGKNKWKEQIWLCDCECGTKGIEVDGSNLRGGNTKSCGCLRKEITRERTKRNNTYDLSGECGIGYDTRGNKFLFDIDQYDLVKLHYWSQHNGYFFARIDGERTRLHRFILNTVDDKYEVDHINQITYDNRKENLRLVTHQQNNWNTGLRCTNTSGYKGVYWSKQRNKWFAKIVVDGKQIHIGFYSNIKEAAKARQKASEKYFGEYNGIKNLEES